MKGQGNIRVFSRFRPFNSKQLAINPNINHRISKGTQLIIKDNKSQEISFMYDHIFDMDSTQQQVYQKVGEPILNNILDGFNGTIMAYGQTSSGKTHTMQGYDLNQKENRGIMPRIIENLFTAIGKSPQNIQFKLKISIFQLYMEKVRDLLDVSKSDLKIRQSKTGNYIQNLTEVYVTDKMQIYRIINIGQKNRITCSTMMNQHSSRSHLILFLSLNQITLPQGASKTSKLYLIDLAGSEKISKTGAQGKVLEQAKKINLSLTTLGKVIKALSQNSKKQTHIPYRQSKLTKILKDSLGGNSKTTLIVACSPHEMHLAQTISTLRFGQNAQKVKNKPKINKQLTVQQLQKIKQKLEGEITEKDLRIKCLEDHIKLTLKLQIPTFSKMILTQAEKQEQSTQNKQSQPDNQPQHQEKFDSEEHRRMIQQSEQRIKLLQQELKDYQSKMMSEMDKYYHLKKQYHDLRDHLTSILTQNIQLKEQIQDKQRKVLLSDKTLSSNVYLIKMIYGQICSYLSEETKNKLEDGIRKNHWFQRIMVQGGNCIDYWQSQKQKICRQVQVLSSESKIYETQAQEVRRRQENRLLKDNQKILDLQKKIGLIFEQYNAMMTLQTHWKAQCQLYERNLRKKDEQIKNLQKQLENKQIFLYEDYDDLVSVKSNMRLVKPLKGGFLLN